MERRLLFDVCASEFIAKFRCDMLQTSVLASELISAADVKLHLRNLNSLSGKLPATCCHALMSFGLLRDAITC